jgi:hypothetical protein
MGASCGVNPASEVLRGTRPTEGQSGTQEMGPKGAFPPDHKGTGCTRGEYSRAGHPQTIHHPPKNRFKRGLGHGKGDKTPQRWATREERAA